MSDGFPWHQWGAMGKTYGFDPTGGVGQLREQLLCRREWWVCLRLFCSLGCEGGAPPVLNGEWRLLDCEPSVLNLASAQNLDHPFVVLFVVHAKWEGSVGCTCHPRKTKWFFFFCQRTNPRSRCSSPVGISTSSRIRFHPTQSSLRSCQEINPNPFLAE